MIHDPLQLGAEETWKELQCGLSAGVNRLQLGSKSSGRVSAGKLGINVLVLRGFSTLGHLVVVNDGRWFRL